MLRTKWLAAGLIVLAVSLSVSLITMAAGGADTRVADAAMNRDLATVRALLRQAADVNAAQGDGSTALHWAAGNGDSEMTQLLLYAGANVNASTRIGGYTPLFMAARKGASSVVEILLKAGADVKRNASDELTPLMIAAMSGSVETVRLLLEHGADVNAKEAEHHQTALMFAAALDRPEVIRELASHGGDLNAATEVQQPPQRPSFGQGQGGQNQGQGQAAGQQPQRGNAPANAASTPQRGQRGTANASNNSQAANPQRGGSATETPVDGKPPATNGSGQAQGQQGQQINEQPPADRSPKSPRGGMTPLMYAARDGKIDAIQALVESGADLNLRSADKSTALLVAIINGHFDAARFLVEHGADVNLPSMDDATPLYGVLHVQWSRESERPQPSIKRETTTYLELMTLLLDHGADPDTRLSRTLWYTSFGNPYEAASDVGTTAFWKCAAVGDIDGMKLLLSRGADPNVMNKDGVTALLIASGAGTHGNDDIEAPPGRLAAVMYLVEDLHLDVNAADNGNTFRGEPMGGGGQQNSQQRQGQQQANQTNAPAAPDPKASQAAAQNEQKQEDNSKAPQQNPFMGPAAGGYTALHNAASRGDNAMILYLVSKGAKVDVVTKTGVTVADMANGPRQRVQPYASTIALLEILGAKNSHKCVSC